MSNMATEPMLPLFDAVEQRATYTVRQLEKIAAIAHEIGHILLHHNGGQDIDFTDYRNNDRYDKKEFEADNFAAALLMPKARSLEVWGLTGDVDDFARAMKVSRKAAAIRLINLGLI